MKTLSNQDFTTLKKIKKISGSYGQKPKEKPSFQISRKIRKQQTHSFCHSLFFLWVTQKWRTSGRQWILRSGIWKWRLLDSLKGPQRPCQASHCLWTVLEQAGFLGFSSFRFWEMGFLSELSLLTLPLLARIRVLSLFSPSSSDQPFLNGKTLVYLFNWFSLLVCLVAGKMWVESVLFGK